MSHSSDLTYLTRAVFTLWTFLWFLQHVWHIDRFEALRWNRVKKHDLKSVITILLVIMCPLQAYYDISTAIIKYQEGFIVNPLNGEIVTKPNYLWSESNKKLLVPTDYVLCANFSLQTCLLFLLQSFWNYLAKNLAKSSFMGSFEFKSYIIYAIFSVFIFPFLQYCFQNNQLYMEIMPQLAYSIFMFLIALFGIRSHKRFTNLLIITRKSSASQLNIILKLEYFRDMNRYLTWSLFIGSISLLILCIDGLTPEKYLNSHKFPADLLMCHVSFSLWLVFVTLMLIFYPSSNTISDTAALTKGVSFSGNMKKNDLLDPPTPQWIRSQNADESQWSSQASSQQSNSQIDNNSYSVEIYEELPPPAIIPYHERKSNSLDIPLTPPSPYRPYSSTHSTTHPIILPPPPPLPTLPKSITSNPPKIQPPVLTCVTQFTQSPTSPIKLSNKLEKLKYPSSPILSRNNSFDKIIINDDKNNQNSSPIYPQASSANVPILSPLPRKSFVGSILDDPSPPKKSSRRPSITSNDSTPVIRVTTSTTSLRSINSITLPSSDEDDKELSTINKITNLDTRKVAPFMYQNDPESTISRSSSSNTIIAKTEEEQEESRKSPTISTEVSIQQSPKLRQNFRAPSPVKVIPTSSTNNKNNKKNDDDIVSSSPSARAPPKSKSSPTPNTSRPPLTSKTWITTKPYQSSPLSKSGSGMNEITSSSSSSSTVKKSSPAQINNPKARSRSGSVNRGTGGAANSVRNSTVRDSIISTRSRSNSTASVGSGKASSSASTRKSVKDSVRNSMNSVSNSVKNSIAGGKTRSRSNSNASVGTKNSVMGGIKSKNKPTGRERSTSSASNSSISSTSSTSSGSSSTGSIKKGTKVGVGKVRRNSKVS